MKTIDVTPSLINLDNLQKLVAEISQIVSKEKADATKVRIKLKECDVEIQLLYPTT